MAKLFSFVKPLLRSDVCLNDLSKQISCICSLVKWVLDRQKKVIGLEVEAEKGEKFYNFI